MKIVLNNEKIKDIYNEKNEYKKRVDELTEEIGKLDKEKNKLESKRANVQKNVCILTKKMTMLAYDEIENKINEADNIFCITEDENGLLVADVTTVEDNLKEIEPNVRKRFIDMKADDRKPFEKGEDTLVDEDNLEVK